MDRQLPGQSQPFSLSERLVVGVLLLALGAIVLIQIISIIVALVAIGYFLFHMMWVAAGTSAVAWIIFIFVAEIVSMIVRFFIKLTMGW